MSFPRYERYKDSGVEWLGEVPEGWNIVPLKRRFEIEGGSTPNTKEEYWGFLHNPSKRYSPLRDGLDSQRVRAQ